MRIGHSKDVHQLVKGRPLVLGGVIIDHPLGLAGHSDADVLTHAVIESIIGALGLGDIGTHFPDTDPRFKGANSLDLLCSTAQLLSSSGYQVGNIDATIFAETPKMKPYISQMRSNLAKVLAVDVSQVNVKATRGEKMGYIGRGEGMGAESVCLLMKI